MDSLDQISLWLEVEDTFHIFVDDEEVERVLAPSNTLRDVYNWIVANIDDEV